MALATVAQCQTHLGLSSSEETTALTQWLAQADAAIKRYIKRDIEEATYTEYYCGDGSNILQLRQYPVQSITSIHVDADGYFGYGSGAFDTADLLTAGTEYALARDSSATEASRTGHVIRIGGVWPGMSQRAAGLLASHPGLAIGNIKVVYVAGYDNVPADLALACCQFVSRIRNAAQKGGALQSESLDYYSYTLDTAGEAMALDSVKSLLSNYKQWVL